MLLPQEHLSFTLKLKLPYEVPGVFRPAVHTSRTPPSVCPSIMFDHWVPNQFPNLLQSSLEANFQNKKTVMASPMPSTDAEALELAGRLIRQ